MDMRIGFWMRWRLLVFLAGCGGFTKLLCTGLMPFVHLGVAFGRESCGGEIDGKWTTRIGMY
jgi:hypothetical protein